MAYINDNNIKINSKISMKATDLITRANADEEIIAQLKIDLQLTRLVSQKNI